MVTRFLDAGHRAARLAGDEVYGGNRRYAPRWKNAGTSPRPGPPADRAMDDLAADPTTRPRAQPTSNSAWTKGWQANAFTFGQERPAAAEKDRTRPMLLLATEGLTGEKR